MSLDLPNSPESPITAAQSTAADAAFATQQRIKDSIRKMRTLWVDLARDLTMFEQGFMYRDLGYQSIGAWMADPDVEIEARWGYQLISMYKEFVVKRGVEPERLMQIEPSKAQVVLPAVRRGADLEEALADATNLARDDLRERYHGHAARSTPGGSMPDSSTTYDSEAEPVRRHCPTCGQQIRTDR